MASDASTIKLAVAMACHNRRSKTLRCLGSLYNSKPASVDLDIHLFDDASTDNTAAAVREEFPSVRIISGDGHGFWCGGMRAAMDSAAQRPYDFLLWLNDDVELLPTALRDLLSAAEKARETAGPGLHIIVGAVADPNTMLASYSGFRRSSKWHPAKLVRLAPDQTRLVRCDTMNGNCVLFPSAVVRKTGEIDRAYLQQIGDVDYGYRCVAAGAQIWVASHYVGFCERNDRAYRWDNAELSFRERWGILNTAHGLPFYPWLHFMWRYGGIVGVLLLIGSYIKWFAISLLPRLTRPRYYA